MKVLMLTPYVTLPGRPELMRNQTGFGYMVMDIARAVARKASQVDLLASDSRGRAFTEDGVHFLPRRLGRIACHLLQCLPFSVVRNLCERYGMKPYSHLYYYWALSGYYRSVLRKGHYDIVHIHGCHFATDFWIRLCQQEHQRLIVTLHGLNSFSETVTLSAIGKQHERDFLRRVTQGEFPITVVSTGVKRLIEKTYGVSDSKGIHVVCNGLSPEIARPEDAVRAEIPGVPAGARVILAVGNIGVNKNQIQLVRAFPLLSEPLRERTYLVFCGGEAPGRDAFLEAVNRSDWKAHFILCGTVAKEQLPGYYLAADGVALISVSEGFGLSLIEGMHYGRPCMMSRDMDAFEDIFDERAVVAVDTREDQAVASAMEQLLTRTWDPRLIRSVSEIFSSAAMADHYLAVYEEKEFV